MESPLAQTTLSTISLLESRLSRLEHLLYGKTSSHPSPQNESVTWRMGQLEKRFSVMLSRVRVYGDLLKIYRSTPDLFHAPSSFEPPSQLSIDAVRSIVLASASAYPATLSALTAVKDSPIPDASDSATLISQTERMKGLQATQIAQVTEFIELRQRSETIIRLWYEGSLLPSSKFMAEVESRVEGAERQLRRKERAAEDTEEV